jgi:hypothetical protein
MTLKRTIHRRAARKRAKSRRASRPGNAFITPDWLIADRFREIKARMKWVRLINREYS